ncbi:MAG: ATP-binding protein [Deltaproteobacteria bacterium]|nr:ATP-binding protein [Deltaproteobacteria bacterium]
MHENEYRYLFISEVRDHLVEIFAQINKIQEVGVIDDSILFDLFRRFHTIKGMANTMGQLKIGELAHMLEEGLEYIRKNPHSIFSFREAIIRGVNAISAEIDNYEKGIPFNSDSVLSEISHLFHGIKAKLDLDIRDVESVLQKKDLSGLFEIHFEVDVNSRLPAVRAFMLLREVSERLTVVHSNPSCEMLKKGIRPKDIKIYVKDKPDSEWLKTLEGKIGEIRFVSSELFHVKDENKMKRMVKFIRVPFERIEELTTSLDELVLFWNKYRYSLDEESLNPNIQRLEYGFKKVLNYAERLRTVPASNIVPKLIVLTENTARSLGKNVRLVVQNDSLEIDKSIIDRLEEPLMHIIRNAVYHGIEDKEERIRIGKDIVGEITILFKEDDEYISIVVRDDGRGMNREKILNIAMEKGLLDKDVAQLKDDEILELVFVPGFSTLKDVDMTSGRGFGMDIVRNVVWQMGGDIKISSKEGVGTEITLQIPYQFGLKKVVVGVIRGFKYAFPISNVRYILKKSDVYINYEGKFLQKGEEKIRLLNYRYTEAVFFIVCSANNSLVAIGIDDVVFVGETRLYKVPYILKSNKFINSMIVMQGICPIPVFSVEHLT